MSAQIKEALAMLVWVAEYSGIDVMYRNGESAGAVIRSALESAQREQSDILEAFTSRCWDAGCLKESGIAGAVVALLQSDSFLRAENSRLREKATALDESVTVLDDRLRLENSNPLTDEELAAIRSEADRFQFVKLTDEASYRLLAEVEDLRAFVALIRAEIAK